MSIAKFGRSISGSANFSNIQPSALALWIAHQLSHYNVFIGVNGKRLYQQQLLHKVVMLVTFDLIFASLTVMKHGRKIGQLMAPTSS